MRNIEAFYQANMESTKKTDVGYKSVERKLKVKNNGTMLYTKTNKLHKT